MHGGLLLYCRVCAGLAGDFRQDAAGCHGVPRQGQDEVRLPAQLRQTRNCGSRSVSSPSNPNGAVNFDSDIEDGAANRAKRTRSGMMALADLGKRVRARSANSNPQFRRKHRDEA